jgi:integrase
MLESRRTRAVSLSVFAESGAQPMLGTSLDHLHEQQRETMKMPQEFVLHSLRHTYGTRLGEAWADVFRIMRLMGHSSATVGPHYVNPSLGLGGGQWKGLEV